MPRRNSDVELGDAGHEEKVVLETDYRLGLICIVVAIVTWMIGLEVANSTLKGEEYNKPWMFSFFVGTSFSLLLLPEAFEAISKFTARLLDKLASKIQSNDNETDPLMAADAATYGSGTSYEHSKPGMSGSEMMVLAAQISTIYYIYNVFVMGCLQYTSASSLAVLGTTTSVYTLMMETFFRLDRFTWKKVVCIGMAMLGVTMIYKTDMGQENSDNKFVPKNPSLGNILAVCGAFMYAVYLVLTKIKCSDARKAPNNRVLFGCVGICSFPLGVVLLCLVHILGIETLEAPPTMSTFLSLLVNGVFSVISDYATILAALYTSPLITSLSLTSSIPITICIDYILLTVSGNGDHHSKGALYFVGVISIVLSVVALNFSVIADNKKVERCVNRVSEIVDNSILSPIISPISLPRPREANSILNCGADKQYFNIQEYAFKNNSAKKKLLDYPRSGLDDFALDSATLKSTRYNNDDLFLPLRAIRSIE